MNIESIKRRLLIKYPLFGSLIANSKIIEDPTVETAETDGENIWYNPKFIESLSNDEQIFVFAHEIGHIAFNHIYRSDGKDQELWNIATDAVLNDSYKEDGLTLVKDVIDIPGASKYDAEEIYIKLTELDEKTKKQLKNINRKNHSKWAKAVQKKQERDSQEQSRSNNKNQEKEDTIKKLTEIGEKEVFKQNKVVRKKQLEDLRNSLASKAHGQGTDTNSNKRIITDIGASSPLIDWRRLLNETVKRDMDWTYQNAEIENGVITAHLERIPTPETEILLDTSGSVNETLLKNFLRECRNIFLTSQVKVGCFDTKFYGFTEIRSALDIDSLSLCGGGGTNFEVAVNAFTKRVENKIIFTDGKAYMPNTPINAIWIVFGNKKIKPAGGKVIYINEEQLTKLCNPDVNTLKR